MAPCVQDATILVDAFDVDAQLFFQHVDFLVECQRLSAEEPRTAKCGAANHHGIDTVLRKGSVGLLQRVNVAVANDGDMDARIALHLADESPVGLSCVHLRACPSVYCQCLDAAVLQLFGQCGDDELLLVPSQTGLHRDRQADGLYHLLGDFEHLGNVLQHTGTRTFASHFLHRTAKVEVNQVGAGLFYDFCRLDHGLYVTPIDLNAHRALFVADGQFLDGRLHIAYQCLGTDKLGIDHRGAKALAEQAETNVGDVFHRSQQDGLFAQIDISYFHPFEFSIAIVVFLAGHVSHVTSLWVGTRAAPPPFLMLQS